MKNPIKLVIGILVIAVLVMWCGTREIVVADKNLHKSEGSLKNDKLPNIYKSKVAIKNGNLVIFKNESGEISEIYNLSNLDKFINDINLNKKSNISILEYTTEDKSLIRFVNLQDIESGIKYMNYDCTSKKYFKVSDLKYFSKFEKQKNGQNIKYVLLNNKDTNEDFTVMKFNKNSIK